jgi:hypothetical protein
MENQLNFDIPSTSEKLRESKQDPVNGISLYMKLHRAKLSIGKVVKNATNPHFKKSYADINALLETVEPILHENGLLLLQPIHDTVLVTQIIDIDSGQKIESWLSLPLITDPQKMISATTYYRRATLQAILALQAVDDDGNEASKSKKELPSITDERFKDAHNAIKKGTYSIQALKETYKLTPEQEAQL